MCDEVANIDKCLFDGGDCCKEYKDNGLCRDCICTLSVDSRDLEDKINALEIKPVLDPEDLESAIRENSITNRGWPVEVTKVVSAQVCAVLCLDHKMADDLNAWHYQVSTQICKCGWVESKSCPENWAIPPDNSVYNSLVVKNHNAFVQLKKTVPCGMRSVTHNLKHYFCLLSIDCLATGFRMLSDSSENAKVDHLDVAPSVPSVWHCVELCRLYDDCHWISWTSRDISRNEPGK